MSTAGSPARSDGRVIVVGVSLTSGSPTALRWAFREASARHAPLQAVTAWQPPISPPGPVPRPSVFPPLLPAEIQVRTEAALAQAVEQALGTISAVTCIAVRGGIAEVLLQASGRAQMLVIGPLHPNLTDTLLQRRRFGELMQRASCPVVIMPPAEVEAG